jgi:cell division protein ZapA
MMKQFEENYAVRDKQSFSHVRFTICSQAEQKQIDNAINGEKPLKELKKSMHFRSISRQLNVLYRN